MAETMDYFGTVLDEITELYEEIEASPHAEDAARLLRCLERAMKIAVEIEVRRTHSAEPSTPAEFIARVA